MDDQWRSSNARARSGIGIRSPDASWLHLTIPKKLAARCRIATFVARRDVVI
jgi:hypothetical protein